MLKNTSPQMPGKSAASIRADLGEDGVLTLMIEGRLDSTTTGNVWREATRALEQALPPRVVVDASEVDYCDGSGIGLLVDLRRRQQGAGRELEIRGLRAEFQHLLDLFVPGAPDESQREKPKPTPLAEEVGRATVKAWDDLRSLIAFVGELCVDLAYALLNPRRVRWKDAFLVAETAGVNALPIIALISFLMGLIMAFQSAIPMRQFGADIFVADLVAISMVQELGPSADPDGLRKGSEESRPRIPPPGAFRQALVETNKYLFNSIPIRPRPRIKYGASPSLSRARALL